ncbi:MAG: GAF domain-containing protein [Acidobacteriota bacterium]|nr:GAF domain-containing protein [Acidobacteriota bacterium]
MAHDNPLTESGDSLNVSGLSDLVESSRIIAETASDAIITIDENSTILFVNHAAVNIFGYSPEEMLGAELTMLMPEYLRHLHRAGLKQYLETDNKHISWQAAELPGLHKNGKEISLELSFGEFRRNGQRFFTGIARDISRRKRDEHRLALQHSATGILANAKSLADASPKILEEICKRLGWQVAAFWSVDSQKNELECVANWRDQASADVAEFEEESRQQHFSPGQGLPGKIWETKEPVWVADFAADQNFPRSSVAARANLHTAFGFPIVLGGEVYGVIELFSEEMRHEDPASLETLAAIGNQMGQFIERKNIDEERVVALASAYEASLEAEALSKRLAALQRITDAILAHLSVDDVIAESLNRIREVLKVDTVAILLLRAEGDELVAWAAQGLEEEVEMGVRIPVGKGFAGRVVAQEEPIIIEDVSRADLYNPLLRQKGIKSLLGVPLFVGGRPTGVLHVGKLELTHFTDDDVRLLQLAADRIALAIENARLYQVERSARAEAEGANRAKDDFLTILSHELRTPLTPIIGWVHIMQHGTLSEADFVKALSVIDRNAYTLKRLINDLLDMSAILSGKMRIEETQVLLAAVLEESVETMRSFARDSRVALKLEIADDAAALTIKGDRSRLNQTFCNIVHNAIKFSLAGKSVKIAYETSDSEAIIRIKDQGEGIPVDFLPHVFERFRQADSSRTRAYGGLGLGLALVRSFVEAHGGTIEAMSDGEGKGSVFTIRLPREAASDEKIEKTEPTTDLANENTRARILIVEDQPDTLEMLAKTFQTRGYETFLCSSGAQALQTAARKHFDILISDIAMPSMDGLQLIGDLRKRKGLESISAIALSGYASQNDVDIAIAAGFDLHLSKPVDPSELAAAVESLLVARTKQKG